MPDRTSSQLATAKKLLREAKRPLRTKELLGAGIHPRVLYELRDGGEIEQVSRGVYRSSELGPMDAPDLAIVFSRVPGAVLCLISALSFHRLTDEIPHEVTIALARGSARPVLDHPPIQTVWFSGSSWSEGIERHRMDGVWIRVYTPEKTLVDIFRYRNRFGLDVAIGSLRRYAERGGMRLNEILRLSRLCRMEMVMRPYLDSIR